MSINTNILLETGTNELEVVEFILNYINSDDETCAQSFGINVAKVREIIRMPVLTKLPNLHEVVCGIFNLRGHIIPSVDICKYLYQVSNFNNRNKMIITEFNKIRAGFIVNDVHRIHRISWSDITSPDMIHDIEPEKSCIVGLLKLENRNILMLDVEKIIADIDPGSAIDKTDSTVKFKEKPIAITVEDSPTIRRMISDRLSKAGFQIHSFNDGQEAWDQLQAISGKIAKGESHKKYVDVIITDIEMPRMDGYSLTKFVKNDPHLAKIPVIIFSSLVSGDVIHKGKSVGADAQLTKPQIGELLEVIRRLI